MSGAARRLAAVLAPLAAIAAVLGAGLASASTDPLELANLRVEGGESNWHPDNDFRLEWDAPAIPERELPIAAVVYQVRDAGGNVVVGETRVQRQLAPLNHVHVPSVPGEYTADVWLEATDGSRGPQGSVSLRFDDRQPGPVSPIVPSGWIAADTPVLARITHPGEPQLRSGIRGYAISIDGDGAPCTAPDRCSEAETDLRGGIGDDTISLGVLPEGVSLVHAVAVSGSGKRSATVGSAEIRVDATLPAVSLTGVPEGWANGPVRLTATATDALSGMAPSGPSGPFTAIAIDDRAPVAASGDSVSTTMSGDGVHSVSFYGRDAAGNAPGGERQPSTALVRIDESPPAVAFARTQDPSEPERIEAAVSDPLSGADPRRGSIAVRPAGSRQRFEPLPTSTAPGRLTAHWDSDSFPLGDYEFKATGYDVAGNYASSLRRSDGARMVLANPLKAQTLLDAGFGGAQLTLQRCRSTAAGRRCRHRTVTSFEERPPTRTVPSGRGVPLGGRLTSITGAPLAGQPIEVIERLGGGDIGAVRTTIAETDADGRFLTHLPPGPSRSVEAIFAGTRTLTHATTAPEQLHTLTGVQLHASAATARIGGPPVVFKGQVAHLAAAIPPNGLQVALQFRLPNLPWTTFRTVNTDPHGHFRYPYTFSDNDSRGVRFQFRAFVPPQNDWPYDPAGSRPVAVTGR